MRDRTKRLLAIKKIISSKAINRQEQLLKELQKAGFELTQATLSRDMKALKLAKIAMDGTSDYKYIIPETGSTMQKNAPMKADYLADGFRGLSFSGNIAVIKTLPGYASSIAAILDHAAPYEILGSVAGDDTILLVMREGVKPNDLINSILLIMPGLQDNKGFKKTYK